MDTITLIENRLTQIQELTKELEQEKNELLDDKRTLIRANAKPSPNGHIRTVKVKKGAKLNGPIKGKININSDKDNPNREQELDKARTLVLEYIHSLSKGRTFTVFHLTKYLRKKGVYYCGTQERPEKRYANLPLSADVNQNRTVGWSIVKPVLFPMDGGIVTKVENQRGLWKKN